MKTLTRRERQEQTRERLLAAAAHVFARDGYHGASIPAIAEQAGLSTGAVYSNFSGKEELFLTGMAEAMRAEQARRLERLQATSNARDAVRATAELWLTVLREQPEAVLLLIEFWTFAVRNPHARERVAEELRTVRAGIEHLIAEGASASGTELPAPPEELAFAVQAAAYGFALQRLIDPENAPDERFVGTLERLLGTAE